MVEKQIFELYRESKAQNRLQGVLPKIISVPHQLQSRGLWFLGWALLQRQLGDEANQALQPDQKTGSVPTLKTKRAVLTGFADSVWASGSLTMGTNIGRIIYFSGE